PWPLSPVNKEAASPQRRPLCIKEERSRQPILKTLQRDHPILIANWVQARANPGQTAELLRSVVDRSQCYKTGNSTWSHIGKRVPFVGTRAGYDDPNKGASRCRE